jgi:deferrochelatase/peroxidase EfeB
VLRRNGTFIAFRKFHIRVATFRKYLRDQTSSAEEEELIAAKMVGRWRSGAPLVLTPEHDDPALGTDSNRNNDFSYVDDMDGLRCPYNYEREHGGINGMTPAEKFMKCLKQPLLIH